MPRCTPLASICKGADPFIFLAVDWLYPPKAESMNTSCGSAKTVCTVQIKVYLIFKLLK